MGGGVKHIVYSPGTGKRVAPFDQLCSNLGSRAKLWCPLHIPCHGHGHVPCPCQWRALEEPMEGAEGANLLPPAASRFVLIFALRTSQLAFLR